MSNHNDLANVIAKAAIAAATNNGTYTPPSAAGRMKPAFKDVNKLLKDHHGTSYYYGDAIPEKKLRNARAAMGIPSTKKIYALYDNTLFGSAKEGACFTDNEIYGRTSSSSEVITYEELTKKTITYSSSGYLRFNDVPTVFSAWFDPLLVKLNKANAPVDMTKAIEAMAQGEYALCIKLLDDEKNHVGYTQPNDLFIYRKLYVEANIAMLNMDNAIKLLAAVKKNHGTDKDAAEYIADAEKRIADYQVQYDRDVAELNRIIESCEKLHSDKKFDEAFALLDGVILRQDFAKKVKRDYYKCLVVTYLLAEKPDDAEATITDLYDKDLIDSKEKSSLDGLVRDLRETLHRRFLQEQREIITKKIETAKMYEKYGIYESASDTLIAALSDSPEELVVERRNLFRLLVEMLIGQYEYDAIYSIGKQYTSIATTEKLGYSLSEKVEQHKSEHIEEYFDHLYRSVLYYMQSGKLDRAEYYLNAAKEVKITFDLRCSEINLAILKLDYMASRELIDNLLSDRSMYDADIFDETLEQIESQYENMIAAISEMLKACVIQNNTDALIANHAYAGFVDAEGLNLPCMAARFANHGILDSLKNNGYGYEFKRTNESFGIAFLAALQMDYDAFATFINARLDSYDGDINCILNENLGYVFAMSEVIRDLRSSKGLSEKQARSHAIDAAFNEAVFFVASLLDGTTRDKIISKLKSKKETQESLVEQMRIALPEELRQIDESTKERCTNLNKAMSDFGSLLSDIPEDDDDMDAETVLDELKDAIYEATEVAKAAAEKKKAAKKAALEAEASFITTIQSHLDAFASIDSAEVVSLLAVPAAAIQTWEYDDENQSMTFTLMHQHVDVEMSPRLGSAISEHSEKLQVVRDVQFEFSGKTLIVKHNYTYSDGTESCNVVFEKSVTISDNLTEDKFVERILGTLKT